MRILFKVEIPLFSMALLLLRLQPSKALFHPHPHTFRMMATAASPPHSSSDPHSISSGTSEVSKIGANSNKSRRREGLGKPKGSIYPRYELQHHQLSGPPPSTTPFLVLGIETSCDDTGVAIVSSNGTILSNVVYSQVINTNTKRKIRAFNSFYSSIIYSLL